MVARSVRREREGYGFSAMGDGGPGGREPVTILSATDRSEVATDRRGSVMLIAGLFIVGVVGRPAVGQRAVFGRFRSAAAGSWL